MASFTLKGIENLKTRLTQVTNQMKANVSSSAQTEAEGIRGLAKEYCPEDSGKLADSIRVSSAGVEQGRNVLGQYSSDAVTQISITAGGPDVPHALAVHEYPSSHNPPSWDGAAEVHFKKGGPKFLERAMQERASGMTQRLGNKILKGLKIG